MIRISSVAATIVLCALLVSVAAWAETDRPEAWADWVCDAPERVTGPVVFDTDDDYSAASMVWDGSAFCVVDAKDVDGDQDLYFRRIRVDGTVIQGPTKIFDDTYEQDHPWLAWTGSEFGLMWDDDRDDPKDIWFCRLDAGGVMVPGSDHAVATDTFDCDMEMMEWDGSGFAFTWWTQFTGDVLFARLDAAGALDIGPCILEGDPGVSADYPVVSYNGVEYGVAWFQDDGGGTADVWFDRADAAGSLQGAVLIASDGFYKAGLKLAWTGTRWTLLWLDGRDGHGEVYYTQVRTNGTEAFEEVSLCPGTSEKRWPSMAWTGAELGVIYADDRNGSYDLYFHRLDAFGTPQGSEYRINPSPADYGLSQWNTLVWGELGFGIVADHYGAGSGNDHFYYLACHEDTTAPTCPAAPAEIARATDDYVQFAWGPGVDLESGISHYQIYRDGVPYAETVEPWFEEAAFDPVAGPLYYFESVNARGWPSSNCESVDTSDNVSPTCPGNLLATDVQTDRVDLAWLPASDDLSGIEGYNIYRDNTYIWGVSETTYSDSTVSAGTTYNYAVTAVDWAGNEQTACDSLWVSTAPITLHLTKNADNIHADLDWNDVSISEYVVYRSPSPQTASELKRVLVSEADDPVLQDGVSCWYYYIQQRGL